MRTEPNQSPIHWSLTCRRGESCSEPTRRRGYRRFSAGAATKPPRNFSSPTSASLALEELRARTLHRPACSEGRRRDVLPTRLPGLGRAVGSFLPHPFPAPGWLAPPTNPHAKAVPRGSRELSPPPRAPPGGSTLPANAPPTSWPRPGLVLAPTSPAHHTPGRWK